MEKDGDSEEVVKQVVRGRFEGRGQKGRSDEGKRGGEKQWEGGNKEEDGGEKYTEKVIRKRMEKKEGERQ